MPKHCLIYNLGFSITQYIVYYVKVLRSMEHISTKTTMFIGNNRENRNLMES